MKLSMTMVFKALACSSMPYIIPRGVGFSSWAMPLEKAPTIKILFSLRMVLRQSSRSGGLARSA